LRQQASVARLSALLLLLPGAALAAPPPGTLSAAAAERLLRAPVQADAAARRVMSRSAQAYARLRSLEIGTTVGGVKTTAWAKRPNLLHLLQTTPKGERLSLMICDGGRYYEYVERRRQWLEREAAVLPRLALPQAVRPFFSDPARGLPLNGLDGRPAAREFAFRGGSARQVRGRPAEAVRVSVLLRGAEGKWRVAELTRFYDRASGLLVRIEGGRTGEDVRSAPNAAAPKGAFRWVQPPGAVRAFG
jgi:hypothetical protein